MHSHQIRQTFIDFFGRLGHHEVPSSPLVPNDPSLLFTNAGMVPFKPYFLGEVVPAYPRLMSVQRCVRTVDIENIGCTLRHATSFEMLGNFSFGDYFKSEVVPWAWELLVDVFGLDRKRLWVTVFHDDHDAFELWRKVGVPTSRIKRLGMEDNFWDMDLPGPCGPCTEIFYERDSGELLEIWNLVFMQYERGVSNEDIIGELPTRNIDTGMGLDRMAMVLQDVDSIHEIDVYHDLREHVQDRVVLDHIRTTGLLIEEGVRPSNEGRGYVLRRLLRRALLRQPRISPLMGDNSIVQREEELFERTLRRGTRVLDRLISSGVSTVDGQTAFKLHDSLGFPIDLTVEVAEQSGLTVDRATFNTLMQDQRTRSRAAR